MAGHHIPYFNFYPADFMNGVRGLTPQEVGIYMMLLCRIYEENGPVEANTLRLSTYCGMKEQAFAKLLARLVDLGKFEVVDGMLTNRRAMAEIDKREDGLKRNSRAGKASAEKRQQIQSQASTDVQQPFNHTDTDTDTDTEREEAKASPLPVTDDAAAAVAIYNEAASRSGWSQVQRMNKSRFSALKARMKEAGGLEGWRHAIERAEASDFLCGRRPGRDGPFFASFDFLTQAKSFTRLMEGTYDNRASQHRPGTADLPAHRPDPALEQIARLAGLGQA